MKKTTFIVAIAAFLMASCGPAVSNPKQNIDKDSVEALPAVQVTDTAQVTRLLQHLRGELYALDMASCDVVTNVDAIINAEEEIGALVAKLDSCQDVFTPAQQADFEDLRGQWKRHNGE